MDNKMTSSRLIRILYHNRPRYLDTCLFSVLKQKSIKIMNSDIYERQQYSRTYLLICLRKRGLSSQRTHSFLLSDRPVNIHTVDHTI